MGMPACSLLSKATVVGLVGCCVSIGWLLSDGQGELAPAGDALWTPSQRGRIELPTEVASSTALTGSRPAPADLPQLVEADVTSLTVHTANTPSPLRRFRISGRVVDTAGRPVVASVRGYPFGMHGVERYPDDWGPIQDEPGWFDVLANLPAADVIASDQDGRFSFEFLVVATTGKEEFLPWKAFANERICASNLWPTLLVSREGSVPSWVDVSRVWDGRSLDVGDVPLRASTTLCGWLVGDNGLPLEGARVSLPADVEPDTVLFHENPYWQFRISSGCGMPYYPPPLRDEGDTVFSTLTDAKGRFFLDAPPADFLWLSVDCRDDRRTVFRVPGLNLHRRFLDLGTLSLSEGRAVEMERKDRKRLPSPRIVHRVSSPMDFCGGSSMSTVDSSAFSIRPPRAELAEGDS